MERVIDMATVSSRGQVCIPSDVRTQLGLKEGSKVLFLVEGDLAVMKPVNAMTYEQLTRTHKAAARRAGIEERDAVKIVHAVRRRK